MIFRKNTVIAVLLTSIITATLLGSSDTATYSRPEPIKYIFTGGPGSGKTSTLLYLESEYGETHIPEAAADVQRVFVAQGFKKPWEHPQLNQKILALQNKRESAANQSQNHRIFLDRSSIDILPYTDTPSPQLLDKIEAIKNDPSYSKHVFLIKNLGSVQKTDYRNEDLIHALNIEHQQETNYQNLGFHVIHIEAKSIEERASEIIQIVDQLESNELCN